MRSDRDMIHGLIQRDPHILSNFVDLYGSYIYACVLPVVGQIQLAEEATQDVMMKVITKAQTFDYSCSLKTWMYTIAKRTAIDHLRKVRVNMDIDQAFTVQAVETSSDDIDASEKRNLIGKLLDELKEDDRELVQLYYLQEMSIKEIEDVTGLSKSNIKVKLFRARQQLTKISEKYIDHEV